MTPSKSETLADLAHRAPATQRFADYFHRQWVRIALLFAAGVVARVPALQGPLIWDDQYLIRNNPFIRSPLLGFEAFRHYLFPGSVSTHYRPVQNLSYCLDYLVWNTNAYGYHLSNLLWHVASGILLFLLLQKLLPSLVGRIRAESDPAAAALPCRLTSTAAFFVALLWLVHPVHSAAVDYVSGRADSLAAFFACAGWLLYLRARALTHVVPRFACYTSAALAALLALCSRESACIWVLIFLLHLFAMDKSSALRRKLLVFAACVAIVGSYAALRQLPHASGIGGAGGSSPIPARAVLMLRALGDYGRLLIFPNNLHMDRTVEADEASLGNAGWRHAIRAEYLSIGGLLFAAALLYGGARSGPMRRLRVFGAAWFFIAFLPISNLIQLNATVAEHWLYLPSIGFLLFVVGFGLELPAHRRKLAIAAACLAVVGLSARSFVRSGDWAAEETFYRQSIRAGASKLRVALNLGQIYTEKGDYAKAEPLLRKVVSMSPDYPLARNSLAHCLFKQGKTAEAEELYAQSKKLAEQAPQEHPRTWVAALNLAQMKRNKEETAGALEVLEKARRDYPGTWELIVYEAEMLRELRGPEAALPLVQEFARANWWHAGAALALGRIYAHQGDVPAAEAALRHASRLDVHDADALNLMTRIRLNDNRFADAYESQRRAVRRQPDQPRQHLLLSHVLEKMGRSEEARAVVARVMRMQTIAQAIAD